ncbi:hypothetical protein ACHAW6_010263, partial [Cyclotella cf. meneghiniana]
SPGAPRDSKSTYPGQCTSVDQFQSTQVGFIAQLKGKLTTQRYRYGTVFVDHFSRLHYIYFMTDQSSVQMLKAKQAYQQFASERGVRIFHFHCDNSHIADNTFRQHEEQQQQTLTFYTGQVSLQFHCRYDDFFETISFNKPETMMSSGKFLQVL